MDDVFFVFPKLSDLFIVVFLGITSLPFMGNSDEDAWCAVDQSVLTDQPKGTRLFWASPAS